MIGVRDLKPRNHRHRPHAQQQHPDRATAIIEDETHAAQAPAPHLPERQPAAAATLPTPAAATLPAPAQRAKLHTSEPAPVSAERRLARAAPPRPTLDDHEAQPQVLPPSREPMSMILG